MREKTIDNFSNLKEGWLKVSMWPSGKGHKWQNRTVA